MNDRDKLYEILKAAEAVLKSGKYENIIDNLRKTIELLDLKDSSAYCNRGYIYLQMNQYQKALDDYNKAIELDPNNSTAYHNRGYIYNELKEYQKAIDECSKALSLIPRCYGLL